MRDADGLVTDDDCLCPTTRRIDPYSIPEWLIVGALLNS